MFRSLMYLAAEPPPAPDLGWLMATAGRALLVLQLVVTALLALRVAADSGSATLGDSTVRARIKDTLGERATWFVTLWSVSFIVGILLFVVGKSGII